MNKLPLGEDLEKKVKELGISRYMQDGNVGVEASEDELQRRVIEMERHNRENKLWIIAVVSAIASVISAITALLALYWG